MQYENVRQPVFKPSCRATTIGSLPHTDVARGTALMFKHTPEIPSWVESLAITGFDRDELLRRALITPICDAGGVLTLPLAERILDLLGELSTTLL